MLGWRPMGLLSFEVRVSRLTAPEQSTVSRATLIVGSIHDDVLLAHESFTLEQFPSPLILSLSTRSAPAGQVSILECSHVLTCSLTHTMPCLLTNAWPDWLHYECL